MGNTPSSTEQPIIFPVSSANNSPNRVRKSEPNIYVYNANNTFLNHETDNGANTSRSYNRFRETQDLRRLSIPIQIITPIASTSTVYGSVELDKPCTARSSRRFSTIFEEKPVKSKIEQPVPDEMYQVGSDTPTRNETEEAISFETEEQLDVIFKWIVEEEDARRIKQDFLNIQEKLRNMRSIRIKDLVRLDLIAQGRHGKIHRVFNKVSRKFYALKAIEVSTEHEAIDAWNEIKTLILIQDLNESSLLKVYDLEYEKKPVSGESLKPTFYILMELSQGSLKRLCRFQVY